MTEYDDIFIRCLVKQDRGLCHQGIEPSSGLIHCFGNEFCRELTLKHFFIFKRIMMLCKRHCSGIEPAVDDFRYTMHGLAAVRAGESHIIDIRAVQFYLCVFRISTPLGKFRTASDAFLMAALTFPYRKRCSPVTVSGNTPVLYIFQPVTETSFSDGFRDPVYRIVVADQILFYFCHLDEPGFSRVVDQRGVTSPAVRILMLELRCLKEQSLCVEIL